ncbi:MAG: tryptophan 2,3-dioxygenase [Bacteroidetes bacterium]|nr:tryptophan 2,3-dioxygenase [Bacteroidota bacterium]
MEITPEIQSKLEQLSDKYAALGQDLNSYLEGLLHADVTKYWDYIELDTLLSIQKPKTPYPDEVVFIIYHQITELYFKLAIREFEQIGNQAKIEKAFFIDRVNRINRYFGALINSFEIMVDGMEQKQFLKFRMSLLPASGFQSAQYRLIEIHSTDFINLVHKDIREQMLGEKDIKKLIQYVYWKEGATELKTGKKTLTLSHFEERYIGEFIRLGETCADKNLWQVYLKLPKEDQKDQKVINALKQHDVNVNINWPLAHYKSAVRYLAKDATDIIATGGTNWQKYLPPRFQKRIFFPELWSTDEKDAWGREWVESVLNQ